MKSSVKFFLESHREQIRLNNFKELYFDAYEEIPFQIGNMTTAFLKAGINPMLYVDKVLPEMFSDSTIKEVTIPNNIKAINQQAFSNNFYLEKIIIPKSVVGIQVSAFKGCYELKEIIYEGTVKEWERVYCEPATFGDCEVEVVTCSDGTYNLPTVE